MCTAKTHNQLVIVLLDTYSGSDCKHVKTVCLGEQVMAVIAVVEVIFFWLIQLEGLEDA